jgi:hypothetical protein
LKCTPILAITLVYKIERGWLVDIPPIDFIIFDGQRNLIGFTKKRLTKYE